MRALKRQNPIKMDVIMWRPTPLHLKMEGLEDAKLKKYKLWKKPLDLRNGFPFKYEVINFNNEANDDNFYKNIILQDSAMHDNKMQEHGFDMLVE